MKIRGEEVKGLNRELIAIPRGGGREDIILWAQAVVDMAEFDKLCPVPKPPMAVKKGGVREAKWDDPDYIAATEVYSDKRMAYLVLRSLDLPENEIEWEKVKMGDHRTWLEWRVEFTSAGFSPTEIQRIEAGCYTANSLNESRVEEARRNFLRGMADKAENTSGLTSEQDSTQSGAPASE